MGLSLYQFRLKKKFGIKLGYTTTPKKNNNTGKKALELLYRAMEKKLFASSACADESNICYKEWQSSLSSSKWLQAIVLEQK